MSLLQGKTGWGLLFLLGLAFPFMAGNDYHLTVMSTAYIFALATVGLNLITGYTGQFNLAHAGFMAVGAYTVGILTVDYQVPFWIAFALSAPSTERICSFIVTLNVPGCSVSTSPAAGVVPMTEAWAGRMRMAAIAATAGSMPPAYRRRSAPRRRGRPPCRRPAVGSW